MHNYVVQVYTIVQRAVNITNVEKESYIYIGGGVHKNLSVDSVAFISLLYYIQLYNLKNPPALQPILETAESQI